MNILTYLLVNQSFWEELMEEFKDVGDMFKDFFLMIKEVTYDVLVNSLGGGESINIILIGIGAIAIMLVLLAIINR